MKFFEATVASMIIRFYIMMTVAFVAGFAELPWLALLCLPIFLSAMLGIKFEWMTAPSNNKIQRAGNTKALKDQIHQAA